MTPLDLVSGKGLPSIVVPDIVLTRNMKESVFPVKGLPRKMNVIVDHN